MATTTEEIRRLCCYAVLKAGYTGNNYLQAHMRLVLCLIYKKNYTKIDTNVLVDDFFNEYHYRIDFFPMRQILSLAKKLGYLDKDHNRRMFHATQKLDEFATVESDIASNQLSLETLFNSFRQYAESQSVSYTQEQAKEIVAAYVNTQKLQHISGHIDIAVNDCRIDYLFGRFVYHIKETDSQQFSYLNNVIVGSILSDCLIYHEELANGHNLSGLTVILDTAVVFMALGIDIANRGEYYQQLLRDLQEKGATTTMFSHSYDEMQYLLSSAADWIGKVDYDPSKASDTAEYFRSINATKDDIQEYSINLRKNIESLGIKLIDADYSEEMHRAVEDEKRIYDSIVIKYKSTNPHFDELVQRHTIERDAKSIAKVYILRRSRSPMSLSDAQYIFVTANQTLSSVAAEYHEVTNFPEHSMPSTITDTFLGTYVWLRDPMKIAEMNEKLLISHAYLAFQPSTALLGKLANTVNSLYTKGSIDADTCYALKSDKLVLEKLSEKTFGDADAYTEITFVDIIRDIRAEAEQQGAAKEREFSEQKQKELSQNYEAVIAAQENRISETTYDLIDYLQQSATEVESALNAQVTGCTLVDKAKKTYEKMVAVGGAILGLLWIATIIVLGVLDDKLMAIVTAAIGPLIWIFGWCTSKKVTPKGIADALVLHLIKRKYKRIGCSEIERQLLQNKLDELQAKISSYKNDRLSA